MDNVALLSFADKSLYRSVGRFVKQANVLGLFSSIIVANEDDIDVNFYRRHKVILNNQTKGYGYWIWKPYFILQALSTLQYGDYLVYLDIGCHLNALGIRRLLDYLNGAKNSECGIACFKYDLSLDLPFDPPAVCPDWKNKYYVKPCLFNEFGFSLDSHVLDQSMTAAGIIVIHNTSKARHFIDSWLQIMESSYHLYDDTPVDCSSSSDFVVSRHDQSVFSLLCEVSPVSFFSGFEHWYPILDKKGRLKSNWNILASTPFHARRDKDYGSVARFCTYFKLVRSRVL